MLILNLGCGTKVTANPDVMNADWSMYLRMKQNPVLRNIAPILLNGERLQRFNSLPDNVMLANLAKGIPFPANSVNAVYHSHLFEHFDHDKAGKFLDECRRVLKPGGILRIVVPDLEILCRSYLAHIDLAIENSLEMRKHDEYIARMFEQAVRKQAFSSRQQSPLRSWVENLILGDARQRGETHQWMYDRVNLTNMLSEHGFNNINQKRYDDSSIPNWQAYGLDLNESGLEYKPDSLYMEAEK